MFWLALCCSASSQPTPTAIIAAAIAAAATAAAATVVAASPLSVQAQQRPKRRFDAGTENIFEHHTATSKSNLVASNGQANFFTSSTLSSPNIMASVVKSLKLFAKNLYLDYYEVFKEIQKGAKAKPIRASIYGGSLLFVLNLFRTNEGLRSYSCDIVSACNRLGAVTEKSRNPRSDKFVKNIGDLHCHGQLNQIDLGFSTLIYRTEANPQVALFRYNCKYLRPSIREFFQERFVDLGLLGHWLLLELNMRDYDINENYYENLNSSSLVDLSSTSEQKS